MRWIKTGLLLLTVPLLLAGCGQQKDHKSSSISSASSQTASTTSSNSSGASSSSESSSSTSSSSNTSQSNEQDSFKYKTPHVKKYQPIEKTKIDINKGNTNEKQFASKYSIPGKLTKIGTVSSGYRNLLVTGTNNQKYLVTIKESKLKNFKTGQAIIVYGSGLTKIKGPETGTGISDSELGSNAMDFSADAIKSR